MPLLHICYTKYLFNHWPEKRSTGKSSSSAMWETYQATLELYGVVWKQLSSVNVCGRPKEIESTCNSSYRVLSLFVVFFFCKVFRQLSHISQIEGLSCLMDQPKTPKTPLKTKPAKAKFPLFYFPSTLLDKMVWKLNHWSASERTETPHWS